MKSLKSTFVRLLSFSFCYIFFNSVANAQVSFTATRIPTVPPATSFPVCADTISDVNGGACIDASSIPTLGSLYPLSDDWFISSIEGYTGISTITPLTRLHVVTNSLASDRTVALFENKADPLSLSNYAEIQIESDQTLTRLMSPGDQYVQDQYYAGYTSLIGENSGVILAAWNPNGTVQFITGGLTSTKMIATSDRKVGIGTVTPSDKLAVAGTIH